MKSVINKVLEKIKPSKEEVADAKRHVGAFISLLNSELKRLKIDAKAVIGGSYAKSTWLSGDFDVDVFVKFNPKYEGKKNISDLLESALLKFKPLRVHGSRDYFQVPNEINFEIVPVLDIKKPSDARNVTDFSPLHVNWVNRNGKGLKDDILLTKKFCKAAKCYGAESYIRGFSGHVVDILVIYYKGFVPLLKAAVKWKPKVVVDPKNVYKGRALFMLNASKIEGPLVVVDPVQPDRNAAAALTKENFDRFVAVARCFLKKPSQKFFVEPVFDPANYDGFVVEVVPIKAKDDVAGVRMVRAFEFVKTVLDEWGIKDAGWSWNDKAYWYFKVKNEHLPSEYEWRGPPLQLEDHVKAFRKIYPEAYVKGDHVYTKLKRKYTSSKDALKSALNSAFVRERVKSTKLL